MDRVLIVKTGDALKVLIDERGDYEDWIIRGLGLPRSAVEVAMVYKGDELPDPERIAGAVVTGSASLVTDREPWSERTAVWLKEAVRTETPVLGICYGHQLLAHGLGGRVARNPRGREIGTVEVRLNGEAGKDALLQGFPPSIRVQTTHVESVVELPPGARLLASSDLDPHHAFALGAAAWGVQFHPEFDAGVVRQYIETRRDEIEAEGLDADALRGAACDSPYGTALLRRFSELLRKPQEI